MKNTANVMFNSNNSAIATPSNAECDNVSPKYASRRQTMKQPSGPAVTATPMPPIKALTKKSSSIQNRQFV
jgi:hypothetical protein